MQNLFLNHFSPYLANVFFFWLPSTFLLYAGKGGKQEEIGWGGKSTKREIRSIIYRTRMVKIKGRNGLVLGLVLGLFLALFHRAQAQENTDLVAKDSVTQKGL